MRFHFAGAAGREGKRERELDLETVPNSPFSHIALSPPWTKEFLWTTTQLLRETFIAAQVENKFDYQFLPGAESSPGRE